MSPSSRDYYKNEHTFWTRIWPYAELAVGKVFVYIVPDGSGGHFEVPLQQMVREFGDVPRVYDVVPHPNAHSTDEVNDIIETDIRATNIHVARITLFKLAAVVAPKELLAKLIGAPRHARGFGSVVGAVAVFVPALDRTQGQGRVRLGHIAQTLSEHHIVNEPTLGRYEEGNIVSSLFPPTNGAAWSETYWEFMGGSSISTTVLTRLGRIIGSRARNDDTRFPASWKLTIFFRRPAYIAIDCYVGPLIGDMPGQIKDKGSKRNSASSYSSQHEGSQAVFLVQDIPKEHIAYIAARGDRYAYVLNQDKKRVVGFVGYSFLDVINFRLRSCELDYLHIDSIMA